MLGGSSGCGRSAPVRAHLGSLGLLGWLFSFWCCCRDGPSILLSFSFLSSELPVPLSSREGSSRGGCWLPPIFVKGFCAPTFVKLVVIYAWQFKSEERSRSTPNWTKAVASVIERQRDEAETISGTDPTVDASTDFTWYEWEESAEVVSGKVPLALPAIGENCEAKKYPSMPCVTSERIQHREKAVKVVRFFDALVSR